MRIITEVKKWIYLNITKKKSKSIKKCVRSVIVSANQGQCYFVIIILGFLKVGELIWIPTEKIELFEIVRNFCAELDDLFVFHRERYTTVLNLMFDQDLTIPEINKFKSFISTLEACEFSLESYISDNDIFNFSKVRHTLKPISRCVHELPS